jgi:hypothetical protein
VGIMSVTDRILYSKNGVIEDVSREVLRYQDLLAAFGAYTPGQDYIYFGSLAPFNHLYLKLQAVSTVTPNTMTLEYWDGRTWVLPYRLDDETKGLTQSGFITFFPDRNEGWKAESTNDRGEQITDLTSVKIYDMFWVRVSLSQAIPDGFSLAWAGRLFSDDKDLGSEFPDLVRMVMIQTFGPTKTNWEEQHVKAAEILVSDLIASQVIDWAGQILVRQEFTLAAVYKVAQIIFNALGADYVDQALAAEREYKRRLDKSI